MVLNIQISASLDRPQSTMATIPQTATMNESGEFTFLPPLQEMRQQQSSHLHSRTNSHQNLQHSAGSSTGSGTGADNPVKQVQVRFKSQF